jgi:hypothetical protein
VADKEAEGLNGAAGVPTVASWWKARSSGLVMMEIWSPFKRLNYGDFQLE